MHLIQIPHNPVPQLTVIIISQNPDPICTETWTIAIQVHNFLSIQTANVNIGKEKIKLFQYNAGTNLRALLGKPPERLTLVQSSVFSLWEKWDHELRLSSEKRSKLVMRKRVNRKRGFYTKVLSEFGIRNYSFASHSLLAGTTATWHLPLAGFNFYFSLLIFLLLSLSKKRDFYLHLTGLLTWMIIPNKVSHFLLL